MQAKAIMPKPGAIAPAAVAPASVPAPASTKAGPAIAPAKEDAHAHEAR